MISILAIHLDFTDVLLRDNYYVFLHSDSCNDVENLSYLLNTCSIENNPYLPLNAMPQCKASEHFAHRPRLLRFRTSQSSVF